MRTKDGKNYLTGRSVVEEKKPKHNYSNQVIQSLIARYCTNNCPHPKNPCKNTPCKEYKQFAKSLYERYKIKTKNA
jgi:hypothetical protein